MVKDFVLCPKKPNRNLKVAFRQNIYLLLHHKIMKLFFDCLFSGEEKMEFLSFNS
jgi:hypothetical protein